MLRGAVKTAARAHGACAVRGSWAARPLLGLQARGLADATKAEETFVPRVLTMEEAELRRTEGKEIPIAGQSVVNGVDDDLEPYEGQMVDGAGRVDSVPPAIKKEVTLRIHQPSRNLMSSSVDDRHRWAFELEDSPERWVNMLMGYASSGQPLSSNGLRTMTFDTREEAEAFAKRYGWNYYVEEPAQVDSLVGKKQYAQNFLNYHVQERRARWGAKKLSKKQFAHPERGNTCWVNLKHTPFGGTASKVVSGTQWSDPHPANHSAKTWYLGKDVRGRQELKRKLGK